MSLEVRGGYIPTDRLRLKFRKRQWGTSTCIDLVDDLNDSAFKSSVPFLMLPLEQAEEAERACAAFNKIMEEAEAKRAAAPKVEAA